MDNSLSVLFVLGLGLYAGARLQRWWAAQPGPRLPAESEARRLAQVECRCSECQPPFFQESPAEVQ